MSRWFRSEPMEYISIIVNADAAHDCLADLGRLGVIQFTDLNPDLTPFQRRYVNYVKRCDELERKIRYFVSEIEKFDLELVSAGSIEEFIQEEDHHPHHFHHPFDDPTDEGIPSMTTATSSTAAISLSSSSPQQPSRHKFGSSSSSGSELLKALEIELSSYELQLRELNTYNEKLTREYNEKVEFQETLEKARRFLYADASRLVISSRHQHRLNEEQEHGHDDDDAHARGEDWLGAGSRNTTTAGQPLPHASDLDLRFSSLTGVVNTDEKVRFERMIFRATRGNCYVRFAPIRQPIVDPETGDAVQKSVFVIFYKSESIELKLKRICDAFSAHRYTLPPMVHDIDHILTDNAQELVDSRTVLLKNQDARFRLCTLLSKHAERWTWIVLREKAVYHTLNMFKADVSGVLRGEGWVVRESTSEVKRCVERAHAHMTMPSLVDLVPQPWPTPPTHFVTNKFTYGYQEFVNTYGIPRYREANPALFTAATFPFLFGVMYGDIGHGLFLFSAGLYLLWNETANEKNAKNLGEMMEGLHAGRYMITMMGFFAIYAGLIYNDCFSLGLDLFGSRWKFPGQDHGVVQDGEVAELISGAEYGSSNSVYPFGLDPIWHVSVNELLFFNSFKMKLSVIFGIIQMFAGTCLKGANAIYFGQKLDFYYEFIPMALFASSLFLYMVFLIFYKWTIDWNSRMLSATCIDPSSSAWGSSAYEGTWIVCDTSSGDGTCTPWGYSCTGKDDTAKKCPLNYGGSGDGCQPPNLITTLINIALNPGVVDEPMFSNQGFLQTILLLIAFGSVPVLLLAKPYFLSKQQHTPIVFHSDDLEGGHLDDDDDDDHEEHGLGEIIIHQAIETIEFVLGMVSNTASYLRLWALSLAHSELATVFWEKAMLSTLNVNFVTAFFGYGMFAGCTFGVLLMMDVLECFLHALRLHWVEFQNKFFKADGLRFAPYSFYQIIKDST